MSVLAITPIAEPPIARFLFSDMRLAPLWTLIQRYLRYAWFMAGWDKPTNPAGVSVGAEGGTVSTNRVLFLLAIGIILGWRVAGCWGIDARCLAPPCALPIQPHARIKNADSVDRADRTTGGPAFALLP